MLKLNIPQIVFTQSLTKAVERNKWVNYSLGLWGFPLKKNPPQATYFHILKKLFFSLSMCRNSHSKFPFSFLILPLFPALTHRTVAVFQLYAQFCKILYPLVNSARLQVNEIFRNFSVLTVNWKTLYLKKSNGN